MRIDHKSASLPMTTEQRYFATAWLNMVHRYSLDSFRVRALNPQNGMRELERMMQPPANSDDLAMVGAEVASILASDPILHSHPYVTPTNELVDLLSPKSGQDRDKSIEKNKHLVQAFARELQQKLNAGYVQSCLSWLENTLATPTGTSPPNKTSNFQEISVVTGNLLSVLLDNGASIESLFQLYRQVIANTDPNKTYVFDNRFSLLVKLLNKPLTDFTVVFSIDNLGNPGTFPASIGQVQFASSPAPIISPSPPVARYVMPFPNRVFAEVKVRTSDERTAGTKAYAQINDILDLVRFEYERNRLHIADEFLCADGAPPYKFRIFPIPKVVPNPPASIEAGQMQQFALSVGELVGSPSISPDGRDRIQSAFRLYRVGADTNIFENKLTSWWTATEYLVKGSSSTGSIGKAVEDTLVPVLCLGYVRKLLLSFRNTLVDMKANITDPTTGAPILLKDINGEPLFALFRNQTLRAPLLSSVAAEPFLHANLDSFLSCISTDKSILSMLKAHERKLRWHIQRIYRARCDIVHSAERVVTAALLCANLEFYLKIALTALLESLKTSPHISGPKEFFDRQAHSYRRILEGLENGDLSRLTAML